MNCAELEQKYYLLKSNWIDGTKEFLNILDSHIVQDKTHLLEIGSGPSNKTSDFLSARVALLDGLDIDERVTSNSALQRAIVYSGRKFPIPDDSYDLVVADYVMEHVEDPKLMLQEINRVLRPGGHFLFRTPNIFHYVSIISRFTPHSFHLAVANQARQNSDDAVDPYPTFYRFNSRRAILAAVKTASMDCVETRLVEKQPSYLQFNSWAYRLGVAYERVVNSTSFLSGLRSNIFGTLVKPKQ